MILYASAYLKRNLNKGNWIYLEPNFNKALFMDNMRVDLDKEREWWDAKAPNEEQDLGDEAINRALRHFSGSL